MTFPLLAVPFIMKIVAALFLICSVALILIILIQKGRGGGLSSAFGGGMASGILGSKTGDFLTWVTISLVGVFLILAVALAKFYKPTVSDFGPGQSQQSPVQQQLPAGSK
jgi:preprotein translocase subunit SecG